MCKVLISTAWSPTHTSCFDLYAQGINNQLALVDSELFISTCFAKSKFESMIGSMQQARQYALHGGFTHLLNVEADHFLPHNAVTRALEHDKDVLVMAGRDRYPDDVKVGVGLQPLNPRNSAGWGSMLVKRAVLEQMPFNFFLYFKKRFFPEWPDTMWFDYVVNKAGFEVWADWDIIVRLGKMPSRSVEPSFAPELGKRQLAR